MARNFIGIFSFDFDHQFVRLDQIGELLDGCRSTYPLKLLNISHDVPHRSILLRRGDGNFSNGGISNAPFRQIDNPLERLLVLLVYDETQIAQHIFNLFSLVK